MIEVFKLLHRYLSTFKMAPPRVILLFENERDADHFAASLHMERMRDDPGVQVTAHTKDHTPSHGTIMGIKFAIEHRSSFSLKDIVRG